MCLQVKMAIFMNLVNNNLKEKKKFIKSEIVTFKWSLELLSNLEKQNQQLLDTE